MWSESDIGFALMVFGPLIVAVLSLIGSAVLFWKGAVSTSPSDGSGGGRSSTAGFWFTVLAVFLLLVPLGICGCYGVVLFNFNPH